MMRQRSFALAVAVSFALGATPAGADVIYVDADAAGPPTGASWDTAYRTVGIALAMASDGDELWIAEGVYTPFAIDQPFAVPPGVALYGGFDGTETARDQRDPAAHVTRLSGDLNGDDGTGPGTRTDNAYTVVSLTDPTSGNRLDGLTISGGEGIGPGQYVVRGGGWT